MIRPITILCLALFLGSGLYLYQSKHRALMLDREISQTMRRADAARQRAGLLQAEYTLLNDPSRLSELTGQLLPGLKTTTPQQFASVAELFNRLPPVGPPPAAPAPVEPDVPAVEPRPSGDPRPEGVRAEAPARPAPTVMAQVITQAPLAPPPGVAQAAARPAAPRAAPPPIIPTPAPGASTPAVRSAAQPAPTPIAPPSPPPRVTAVPPRPPVAGPAMSSEPAIPAVGRPIGSALGMARTSIGGSYPRTADPGDTR